MEIKIYRSIKEIDEKEWNAVVGRDRIICSHKFLEALEKSNINDCEFYYLVVYNENKIIAHASAYSISTELDTFAIGLMKYCINIIRKLWKNFLIAKFMECGSPVALGNTISFCDGINKKQALSLIIENLENIAKRRRIGIVFIRDFYDNEISFYDHLLARKFKKVNNLPNTILGVKWNTFDEYLENVRSHYKCKINKNIQVAVDKGLTVEIINEFTSLSEQLQILWRNVYDNAKEYRREILTREFFTNMNDYLGDKSKVILFKKKSNIIGFALVLIDDDSLRFMFSGLDYNFSKEYRVYFNFFYHVIKLAIDEGKQEIDMGITTYFPKTDVGAKMTELYGYMKHLNPLLNPVLSRAFVMLSPKIDIKTNYIFKGKNTKSTSAKKYSIVE